MTPDYPYGCKRRVFDSDWLSSMNKSNFTLTNRPVIGLHRNELLLGPEDISGNAEAMESSAERVHAEVVILANGFEATQWLHPLCVYGRHGVALHDIWRERGGPQAYMGLAVDGFPNLFIAVGPNTVNGHNSLILAIENTVGYILKMVGPILKGAVRQTEVKKEALEKWTKDIQRDLKKTVFVGCRSWYMDERGYNSTMYPYVFPYSMGTGLH
jgi:cation diffusion facilitator CzcD-associated flavoprotein CzcO